MIWFSILLGDEITLADINQRQMCMMMVVCMLAIVSLVYCHAARLKQIAKQVLSCGRPVYNCLLDSLPEPMSEVTTSSFLSRTLWL